MNLYSSACLLAILLSPISTTARRHEKDLPVPAFARWAANGPAFASGPVSEKATGELGIENAGDDSVATSKPSGDRATGTLTSPSFRISKRYIGFRISGGDYEHDLCLNLLVRGKIVKSATGWRSDRLTPESWDVRKLIGQAAQVQIVDNATGEWGHISVDHIVQTEKPERLPVVRESLYRELLRPQFHFTARQWTMDRLNPREREEGWINDLNGLIYYDGEYHMFAQRWNKCWLHAVSRDLVHWTELEPAFWEEELGSGCQSGTCVIDYRDTSGLSPEKSNPPMIAFWSRADNQGQCISYSLDHGRTWKHYAKNPIMVYPERDPKVFWYGPGNHWVMMLYGNGQYHILTSSNLLDWKDAHEPILDSFECPDFFQLPLDGDVHHMKWVLIQGSGFYSIGDFDGTKFKEETKRYPCDIGPNFYATQSWANVETGDGRRIQAAWMRGSDFPNMPFSQQISFPCLLTLHSTPTGPRLFREPIHEIDSLRTGADNWSGRVLKPGETLPLEPSGELYDIHADVDIPEGARLTFDLRGATLTLANRTIESGSSSGTVLGEVKSIEILLDRASVEAFVNHGEVSSTRFVLPSGDGIAVRAEGGPVNIRSMTVYPLASAWRNGEGD